VATKRRIAGLCSTCALLVGAALAPSAGAAESTAVECTTTGTQIPETDKFSDEHCKTKSASGSFFHAATPVGTKTASEVTNITTGTGRQPAYLESVVGGLNTILEAKKVEGTGTVENAEAGGEMYAEGLAETLTFSEVTVTNRACEIFGITPGTGVKTLGTIKTQPIRGSTKGQATGIIKFEPQTAGGKFAEFELTGASCPEALKGLYPVFGTFLSQQTEGATTPITHKPITEAQTLRLKSATTGLVAGLSGQFTVKKTSGGVPIALTPEPESPPPPPPPPPKDSTAVECTTTGTQIPGTEKFSDAHCKSKSSTGSFFHAATPVGSKTASQLTNTTTAGQKEPLRFEYILGTINTIIEAKTVSASGTVENNLSGTEMYSEFLTNSIVLEEVIVTNRTCEFVGINPGGSKTTGKLETQPIRGSTKGQSAGVTTFEPQAGGSSKWFEFELTGASCPEFLVGIYPVYGAVRSNASEGATIPLSHAPITEAKTLRLKSPTTGPVAGLAGRFTVGNPSTGGGIPIALNSRLEPESVERTAAECTTSGTQIPGTEKFADGHCKEGKTSGSFFHAATPVGTPTASELTNLATGEAKEPGFLKAIVGGLETIIEAKRISAGGELENAETGGEMFVEGKTNSIVFEEVKVTNRTCTFTGINPGGSKTTGTVESQPIRGTTKGQAVGVMKIEPQTGNKIAEFELTGASCPEALKGLYPVFGSVLTDTTEGATTPLSHAPITTAKTLRLKNASTGPIAGLAGKITVKKTSSGAGIALTSQPEAVERTAAKCTTTGTQIPGTEKFSDAHCKEGKSSGSFFHVATPVGTPTASELTNLTTGEAREPGFLKATIGGLETIIEARRVSAGGELENSETGGEMFVEGKTSKVVFEEVKVTNRTCEFVGINPGGSKTTGTVETQPIKGTTKGQATGVMKIEPQAGSSSKFAEFELTGASCPAALKGLYPVFGTVLTDAAEGATIPFSHATVTGEPVPKLRLKNATEGPVAGLAGKITVRTPITGGGAIAFT
jgi:hypothetical protein